MPKFDNASIEAANIQRREAMDDRPQDRYAGRGKFQFCHRCGSREGLQIVHCETIEKMEINEIMALAPWHSAPWEPYYLFYICPRCNTAKTIPDGYEPITKQNILAWLARDPMAPNYAALGGEPETATAGQDSRESAGLEG